MSRAVVFSGYGGPEVLEVAEVDEPHAGAGQVRVAVRAAGLNPFDVKVRRGTAGLSNHRLPSLQGAEFAGVIDEVGESVTGFSPGDEVLGWIARGAQAEYVVVPEASVAPKPEDLDWATAAGIGLVGNTAKRGIDSLELTADDTVYVSGVAGGVGLPAAQLALRTGARVVGTASDPHHEFLHGLGITPVAYEEGMLERLRKAAAGYTAMFDTVGGEAIDAALALGIPPARINTIADSAAAKRHGLSAVGGGNKTSAELAKLAALVAQGDLIIPVRAAYPLADVRDAYRDLETGHGLGKVVLLIS